MKIILFLIILLFTSPLFAKEIIANANKLIADGKTKEAKDLYINYLVKENYNTEYTKILNEASFYSTSIDESITIINRFKDRITNSAELIDTTVYLATLYELKSDLPMAIKNYDQAYQLSGEKRTDLALQKIALLLDMGETSQAKDNILKIYTNKSLPYLVKNKLLALIVNLYHVMSSNNEASSLISDEKTFIEPNGNALLIYSICLFYSSISTGQDTQKVLQNVINKKFTPSPEAMIINHQAKNFPSPIYLW